MTELGEIIHFSEKRDPSHINVVLEMDDHVEKPCWAYANNIAAIFELVVQSQENKRFIHVNLTGILEMNLIPHFSLIDAYDYEQIENEFAPAVLIFTYLTDLLDKKSYKTVSITGMRGELITFRKTISEKIEALQKNVHFRAPKLPSGNSGSDDKDKQTGNKKVFSIKGQSKILEAEEIETIRYALPMREKYTSWKLLFSTMEHGVSLQTIFDKTKGKSQLIMVVLGDDGTKFGAYLTKGLKKSKEYHGSGEMFVFTTHPSWSIYKWSKANENFAQASDVAIIVGSNNSAIFLSEALEYSFSEPCQTFESPTLTSTPKVKIIDCEFWEVSNI